MGAYLEPGGLLMPWYWNIRRLVSAELINYISYWTKILHLQWTLKNRNNILKINNLVVHLCKGQMLLPYSIVCQGYAESTYRRNVALHKDMFKATQFQSYEIILMVKIEYLESMISIQQAKIWLLIVKLRLATFQFQLQRDIFPILYLMIYILHFHDHR